MLINLLGEIINPLNIARITRNSGNDGYVVYHDTDVLYMKDLNNSLVTLEVKRIFDRFENYNGKTD